MQPYQEEYISNIKQAADLAAWKKPDGLTFEQYAALLLENEERITQASKRSMELLRGGLFPVLDNLLSADAATLEELEEFSSRLYDGRTELDAGLFCQIRLALLTLARQRRNRAAMIRHLYWLGMGRNCACNKLVGLELSDIEKYMVQMRLCFTEGAAYLKYYDEIDDMETRSYILRCRANISLGQFGSPGEKVHLIKKTLQILQDQEYQKKAPQLPWARFIYLTHQNMSSSISYSKEKVMSAQDMADIMDSVYIVYHQQIQQAKEENKPLPAKSAFLYHAIQYYCGILDLDYLLNKMEELMDTADTSDFSPEGMYGVISLPAFYCQYLCQYPERVPARADYVEGLYRRVTDYVDAFPQAQGDGTLFRFLRQLAYTYVETDHSIPYGGFLQMLLLRFAPEIYIHSHVVGEAARALCQIIWEDEPGFFDDIHFIRAIQDPEEKHRELLSFAMSCGLFHDVGKINVIELYSRTARQWFDYEYEMARLHTLAGEALLSPRASTQRYTAAALGHHAWYDGSHGYPDAYRRLECPSRQMVDVISLISWLENTTHTTGLYTGRTKSLDEAVQAAIQLEGKRFSRLLTARLRDAETVRSIRQAFVQGRQNACRRMYDDACRAVSQPAETGLSHQT